MSVEVTADDKRRGKRVQKEADIVEICVVRESDIIF